jgi:hypothetical protein
MPIESFHNPIMIFRMNDILPCFYRSGELPWSIPEFFINMAEPGQPLIHNISFPDQIAGTFSGYPEPPLTFPQRLLVPFMLQEKLDIGNGSGDLVSNAFSQMHICLLIGLAPERIYVENSNNLIMGDQGNGN